ncbi:MAG: hypothetical protein HY907_05490 [Deltaproteobacteria bacterium]|nr:hypothetical protein [Deltaproteobacteria bacterium]
MTEDAPASTKAWARLLSFESLRYHGSGWWLDAALPRSPAGVIVAALALPAAWFAIGLAVTPDRAGYIDTPDVKYQLPFLALHILCLRVMGSLWARGVGPALDGLGVGSGEQRWVHSGVLGSWANLGALLAAGYFIGRDTYMALVPDPVSGLSAFDDPGMWDFASLGHGVRALMLGLWHYEWLIYGYLMWLQLWCLIALSRALQRTDFTMHLERLLLRDDYRDFFALLGKTATVSMVFALGNLGFIHLTGELFPHEAAEITGVGSFLTEMSDLLSTALLFVVLLVGFVIYLKLLRGALTKTVNQMFAAAGDAGLAALAEPLEPTGDGARDVERLRARVNAQAALVRAISFQREVDAIGGRSLSAILLKSSPALMTTLRRLVKLKIGVP